jgi:Putative peptidoglycan binding domain
VPRKITVDDEAPRRRRGARAIKADEHGLVMRIFLRSPRDVIAGALTFAVVTAIITNALFLQAGRHPAPMFGSVTAFPAVASAPVNPLPRPRPADADAFEAKVAEQRAADLMTNLVKTTGTAPRPPVAVPVSTHADANSPVPARRIAAVQRALTDYGYGQLKPTGTIGSDTQAAIQKFERARKLPVTGQLSDRLVRELTAMIGHSID